MLADDIYIYRLNLWDDVSAYSVISAAHIYTYIYVAIIVAYWCTVAQKGHLQKLNENDMSSNCIQTELDCIVYIYIVYILQHNVCHLY